MKKTVRGRIDKLGRRHPRLMLLVIIALTILVTLSLLYYDHPPTVLYQGF